MHKLPQKMVIFVSIIQNYFNGHIGTVDHSYEKSSKEKNNKSVYVYVSSELIGKTEMHVYIMCLLMHGIDSPRRRKMVGWLCVRACVFTCAYPMLRAVCVCGGVRQAASVFSTSSL